MPKEPGDTASQGELPLSGAAKSGIVPILSADVYERRSEYVFMTRDDYETLEARAEDKSLFQNLGILFLAGGVPLGIEKALDWYSGDTGAALSIFVVCLAATVIGIVFLYVATKRRRKIEAFKDKLFSSERLVASNVTMFPLSTGTAKVSNR